VTTFPENAPMKKAESLRHRNSAKEAHET
jgi:hypothetical protein